jgi:hypothetical protein
MFRTIVALTKQNPVLALVAALLIGISTMGSVVLHQNKRIEELNMIVQTNERYYQRKNELKDSLYRTELQAISDKANKEVQDYLVKANAEMAEQIRQLQEVNSGRSVIYNTNRKVIDKNRLIIKKLQNVN